MPDKRIESVVADILAADPALKAREAELRDIVSELLSARPDAALDPAFAARLRERLLAAHGTAPTLSFFERLMNKPLAFALGGGAVVSLALFTLLVGNPRPSALPSAVSGDEFAAGATQIAAVSANAFGSLANVSAAVPVPAPMAEGSGESARNAAVSARPQSGGGGMAMAVPADAAMSSKMMVPPDWVPTVYEYSYDGDIPLDGDTVDVYRRVKGLQGGVQFGAFRGLFGGLLDPAKLSSGKLQMLSMLEDREFGYSVSVDAVEGNVSMSQNWQRWPHPENQCATEECYAQYRLRPEQMPSDEDVIAIADDFLADYGVNRAAYGSPEVRAEWRAQIAAAADVSSVYLPDSLQVVYPLRLEGQTALDESGNGYGLAVNVNVRHRKVDGMWGLTGTRFEKSSYAAVTDAEAVRSHIAKLSGDWTSYEGKINRVALALGAPDVVLSRAYTVDAQGNGQELFVPMLRFPIVNPPADQPWFQKAVLVPLAQELMGQGNAGGYPMPFIRADAESAPAVMMAKPAVEPSAQ